MSLDLPPVLRIQASIVRRHAEDLAKILVRVDRWEMIPNMIVAGEEIPAIKSAITFALAVLMFHDNTSMETAP